MVLKSRRPVHLSAFLKVRVHLRYGCTANKGALSARVQSRLGSLHFELFLLCPKVLDRPLYYFWTVYFHSIESSTFILRFFRTAHYPFKIIFYITLWLISHYFWLSFFQVKWQFSTSVPAFQVHLNFSTSARTFQLQRNFSKALSILNRNFQTTEFPTTRFPNCPSSYTYPSLYFIRWKFLKTVFLYLLRSA